MAVSKPSVKFVPVYLPSGPEVPADTNVADQQGKHDDDPSNLHAPKRVSLHAPKRVRTQQETPVHVNMSKKSSSPNR